MLANTSQLLLRNISDLTGPVLIVEPEADALGRNLRELGTVTCFTTDTAVKEQWQQAGVEVVFSTQPQFSAQYNTAVVFFPKSKELLADNLARISTALSNTANIYIVGDNKGGIKSLVNHVTKLGLNAHKLDNAKHCLWFALTGDLNQLTASKISQFSVEHQGHTLTIRSMPGVFNHGKLDTGTALLLQHLNHIQDGRVLDFACGAGIIGAALKLQAPAIELYCSDISALAVTSTSATLAANQLNGQVLAADGLPAHPALFKHIVSNPPFHTGIKTDYSISEMFIAQSAAKLQVGGTLTLVANNHLAYQQLLEKTFGSVTVLAKANGFVVYQTTKK